MAAQAYPAALDLIERLEDMTSADEVWSSLLVFAGRVGLRFGTLSEVPGPNESFDDVKVCLTWPEEWSNRYRQLNYINNDPAVLHSAHSLDPYTWSEALESANYSKFQTKIVREGTEFGLTEGFVIPIINFTEGPSGIALAGSHLELSVRDRAEMQLAAIYAHAKIRALRPRQRKPKHKASLSPRERECMHWVAAGKSDWEIAEILTLSHKTVHNTVERAKQKLGVPTRVQAVVAAIRIGLVAP